MHPLLSRNCSTIQSFFYFVAEKVLERGEKIDILVDKAEGLEESVSTVHYRSCIFFLKAALQFIVLVKRT